jgi:hypothetical protein
MSRRCPTLQRLWLSLSMATSSMDPNLGTAAPYRSVDGAMRRVLSRHSSILCLGLQKCNPSTNRETDGVSALGGCHSVILHNNQPKDNVGGGEGTRDEMQPGRNVWGAMFAHRLGRQMEGQKIIEIKYVGALGGCQMTNRHNNQPKQCRPNLGGIGEEAQPGGECGGSVISLFWGQSSWE